MVLKVYRVKLHCCTITRTTHLYATISQQLRQRVIKPTHAALLPARWGIWCMFLLASPKLFWHSQRHKRDSKQFLQTNIHLYICVHKYVHTYAYFLINFPAAQHIALRLRLVHWLWSLFVDRLTCLSANLSANAYIWIV